MLSEAVNTGVLGAERADKGQRSPDVVQGHRLRKPRQDNIDLLRAIAILSVVFYHFTTRMQPAFYRSDHVPFTFPWGHHGVDLFFIVSGFCIFMTLDSSRSLENFWARRLARIQPAYVAGIAITFAVVTLAGLPGREVSPLIALSNTVWLNVIPYWPEVDSAYWSLVVELKFYVIIGVLYYCLKGRHVSAAWLGVCAAGYGLGLLGSLAREIGSQLIIAPMAPFFLIGLLAWERRRLPYLETLAVAGCAVALSLTSARFTDFPWTAPIMGVLAFVVLQLKFLKVPGPITIIGLVSYSFYLLHQNIGYVLIRALPFSIEFRIAAATAIVLAMAFALYFTVERRWERRLQQIFERILGAIIRLSKLPWIRQQLAFRGWRTVE